MRTEQLTFTRFIAAIAIVVFHYGRNVFPFSEASVKDLFNHAFIGVCYFFILSGFVMIIAYKKRGHIPYPNYLKKRFARIYPVYFLAILVFLAYFLFWDLPLDHKAMIKNILMIQAWIPGQAMLFNSPGWSLCVEVLFYVSFPFLFNKFYSKWSFKKLLWPILLFFVVSQATFHILLHSLWYADYSNEKFEWLHYFPLMHLNEFLIGNLAGLYFLNKTKTKNYDIIILLLFAALYILLSIDTGINFHNGMMAFLFVPFIFCISSNNGLITKLFSWKRCVFLGEISYGIYIFQLPIFHWMVKLFPSLSIESPAAFFYSSFLVLIVISALSYIYIETPLRNKINRIQLRKLPVEE